jgi:uncharacterized protein involved in response to NO
MIGRWSILLTMPHRGTFAAGMAQGLLAMGLWALDLAGRYGGMPSPPIFPPGLPPSWFHAGWLIYGVFAFFIFGFILTAGPRWQQHPDTAPAVYRPVTLLMATGWLVADIGLALPLLLPVGLLLALGGWLVAVVFLWRLTAGSPGNRLHIGAMAAAQTAGATGLLAFAILAAGGPFWLGPLAIALGLWTYLLPVFLIVMHRMLPFFCQGVIPDFQPLRPAWALRLMLACSVGHGLATLLGHGEMTWLADIPLALTALWLTHVWRWRESFAATILAVLHVAFAWVGFSFLLFAADSLLVLFGSHGLGRLPLHALTLGFCSSALIGMVSRVTLGHSGRPIVGDTAMWLCFWAMQVTALLRMAGEAWPMANPLAALLWLSAFAAWAWRYAPAYWRSHGDGQAG